MNPLVKFYIKKKLKRAFNSRVKLLLKISGTILISLLYGFGISFFIGIASNQENVNLQKIFFAINIFFGVAFLLTDIFPFYKKAPHFIPNYYPIKKRVKLIIAFISYHLRFVTLFVLMTLVELFIINSQYGFFDFFISITSIFGFYIFNRIIKNIAEYNFNYQNALLLLSSFVIVICNLVSYQALSNKSIVLIIYFICYISLLSCLAFIEDNKLHKLKRLRFSFQKPFLKILSNKNISRVFLIGLFFKLCMLSIATLSLKLKNEPLYDSYATTWIFASPIMVFSYIGLNFFGYSRNLYFTHLIRSGDIKKLISIYIKSVGVLLLIDNSIFGVFVYVNNLASLENILFYYSLAISLTYLGFYYSVKKPIFKDNFISLDFSKDKGRNIDLAALIFAVLTFICLYLIKLTNHQFILSLPVIIVFSLHFNYVQYDLSKISYRAFSNLKSK